MKQSTLSRKVASRLGGYDIFISYRHLDAEEYAEELHKILESKGLIVFRDESEADNLGTSVEKFAKLACSARCLVMIITPDVYRSVNVYEELSSYLANRIDKWYYRPFSRIISINVESSLSKASSESFNWSRLSNFVYEPESSTGVAEALPSIEVVKRLISAGTFMNSWRRFVISIALITLILFAGTAGVFVYLKSMGRKIISTQKQLKLVSDSSSSLSKANKTLNLQNTNLQAEAEKLNNVSDSLRGNNFALSNENVRLQNERSTLVKEGTMLQYQNASLNFLERDPVMAYRLAEEAYRLEPNQKNRRAIMQAASKIGLAYTYRKAGFGIDDVKEPYILMKTLSKDSLHFKYSVMDTRTRLIHPINIIADQAWLVLYRKSWRVLAETELDDESQLVYRLFSDKGKVIGNRIAARGNTPVQFINDNKVRIFLESQDATVVWNLQSDERVQMDIDKTIFTHWQKHNFKEGPLDTRHNGDAAIWYKQGLVLMTNAGKIDEKTFTESVHWNAFFESAWSNDGAFLAIQANNYTLLLWDPASKQLQQISPPDMQVNVFAWAKTGHTLAFAGYLENNPDGRVYIADSANPTTIRKVYDNKRPFRNISFSTDNRKLILWDRIGELTLLDVVEGKTIAHAFQNSVMDEISPWGNIFCTKNAIYCYCYDDFRIWSTEPAFTKNWLFLSDPGTQFGAYAAGDPSYHWLAIVAWHKNASIILRDIRTGADTFLRIPMNGRFEDDPVKRGLRFSSDGKWLFFESRRNLRIWDTKGFFSHDFAPLSGGEFRDALRIDANFIRIKTSWSKETTSNPEHVNEYVIQLDPKPHIIEKVFSRQAPEEDDIDSESLMKEVDGWEVQNQYRYQLSSASSLPYSGWAYFSVCEGTLLGNNCQFQFIPRNLNKVMDLYNSILWKPSSKELKKHSTLKQ